MDGETALKYARERHDDPEGDFGRAKRQQQVMQSFKNKFFSVGTFLNVFVLVSVSFSPMMRFNSWDEELDDFTFVLRFPFAPKQGWLLRCFFYFPICSGRTDGISRLHFGFSESRDCVWMLLEMPLHFNIFSGSLDIRRFTWSCFLHSAWSQHRWKVFANNQRPRIWHGACSLEHRRCGLLRLSSPHVHGRNVRSDESLFFLRNSCHWCSYGSEDLCLITGP